MGGTWLSAYSKSPNLELAKNFIQWVTTNQVFLTKYSKDTEDFSSSMKVVDKIKGTSKDPFLGGQSYYSIFEQAALGVNATTITGYDQEIDALMNIQLTKYINGQSSCESAINAFKLSVVKKIIALKRNESVTLN